MFCHTFPFPSTDEYKTKKLVLRKVNEGTYVIGHTNHDSQEWGLRNTPHGVAVPSGTCYYIGVFPLTTAQYDYVMGIASNRDDTKPKSGISWNTMRSSAGANTMLDGNKDNTENFLVRFNGLLDGQYIFDLPTEEMWEIAARAGATTYYYWGDDASVAGEYAWYSGNNSSSMTVYPVGEKRPNAWGIYDTAGNEWEWCRDILTDGDLADKTSDIYTANAISASGDSARRILRGSYSSRNAIFLTPSCRGNSTANSPGAVWCHRIAYIKR